MLVKAEYFRRCLFDTASSTKVSTHRSIAHRDIYSSIILMRAGSNLKSLQNVLPSIFYLKNIARHSKLHRGRSAPDRTASAERGAKRETK